jgi:O-antigen/teichoic acid export membrane protein
MISPEMPPSLTRQEVTHRAARGVSSMAMRMAAVQSLQLVSALALARLIRPDEYGTFAVALMVVGAARYFGDLGIAASLVTSRTISHAELQTGAYVGFVMALAQAATVCALSPLLGNVLGGPGGFTWIVAALAATLVIDSFRLAPTVRLNRALSFSRLNAVSISETAVLYLAQIGFLLAGLGLWGLVFAQVARAVTGTLLLSGLGGKFVPPLRRVAALPLVRSAFAFQAAPIVLGLAGVATPAAVGLALSAEEVGLWAWSTVLAAPLGAVLLGVHHLAVASFSRLLDTEFEAQDRAARLALRLCALVIAWPAGVACGLAPEIIPLVFEERWFGAVAAVQLCLVGLLATTVAVVGSSVLDARREAWRRARCLTAAVVIGLATTYPLAREFGVMGAALASGVVIPLVDAVLVARAARVVTAVAMRTAVVGFGVGFACSAVLAESVVDDFATLAAVGIAASMVAGLAALASDRQSLAGFLRHVRAKGMAT